MCGVAKEQSHAPAKHHPRRHCHGERKPPHNHHSGNYLSIHSLSEYASPDLTLPGQYFAAQKNDDGLRGEKALMYAVLEDGIKNFYRNLGDERREQTELYEEAEEWICEDTCDAPFDFNLICDMLGINPVSLRERLMEWKQRELLRRELTGDTESIRVGLSPFPVPIAIDELEAMSTGVSDDEDGYDRAA